MDQETSLSTVENGSNEKSVAYDSNGNLLFYDAYGNVSIDDTDNRYNGNRYMFTGRRYDEESGLYYYRARMYNPGLGRFLQSDPMGYIDTVNPYAYCANNLVNFVDPGGKFLITGLVILGVEYGAYMLADRIGDFMENLRDGANDFQESKDGLTEDIGDPHTKPDKFDSSLECYRRNGMNSLLQGAKAATTMAKTPGTTANPKFPSTTPLIQPRKRTP
ncbi:MAG: RHS repeat-associated core domain-containing protein, partial [Phycisphaerae bacterium]